ncbi:MULTISPECIES: baseplate assembly protein [Pseudoalteromonas]|uniref:Phage-related baseplate assembly protein n=1 Tax=Pseudoalteromonas luteoviolacea (strain 2ta16) TaxID=1353533 RepID=V4I0A4_PSEL2|nr:MULTISPECIES: baseplate J/gp47 family protein [Pseudoalteromonas]ESP95473.1 phage-related baseplate assembly protein [Pseudoalteromonas luteoviolacea 2ta16]KZN31134.1 hypothetical protein N483_04755 [Pseudoalteromonas luteoviolacea NCIMB 1944]MCG7548448.1 baseplate J/gp47 family protein [Pseudoalteromonas sp. Of7M-16]
MNSQYFDFSALPAPDIIEPLDYESIYQARKERFKSIAPQYAGALELESDPLTVCLQVESYRELLLRQRINEAAYANLLATAQGGDLDQLGVFYGLGRAEGEEDGNYRLRIRQKTLASSTAGSKDHYRNAALTAAPNAIRDVEVDSPTSGRVRVSILFQDNEQADVLLQQVRDYVLSDQVKVLTDQVEVNFAQEVPIDVKADIYLQHNVPNWVFTQLEDKLRAAWQETMALGVAMTPSWLSAQLHVDGVKHVEIHTPDTLIDIASNQYAQLGQIQLCLIT